MDTTIKLHIDEEAYKQVEEKILRLHQLAMSCPFPSNQKQADDIVICRILEVMNRAIETDQDTITELCKQRVQCNKVLCDDPTIQVGTYHVSGEYTIGLIGILSGIAGTHNDGYSNIAAEFETVCPTHGVVNVKIDGICPECTETVELGRILRFVRTKERSDQPRMVHNGEEEET